MMSTDQMIEVLQAHKNGKPIETLRHSNSEMGWYLVDAPYWNFFDQDYRIRPDPKALKQGWIRDTYLHVNPPWGASSGWIFVREVP